MFFILFSRMIQMFGIILLSLSLVLTVSTAGSSLQKKAKKAERSIWAATHKGDYSAARDNIQKYLAIKKSFKKNNINLGKTYNKVAHYYKRIDDFKSAMTYFQKSIDEYQKMSGKKRADIGVTYADIATLYAEIDDFKSAMTYFQKSIDAYQKLSGKKRLDIGDTYNKMSDFYMKMKDYEQAVFYEKKFLLCCKKMGRLCKNIIPHEYKEIGSIYKKMKNYPDALKYYQHSLEIFQRDYGKSHVNTIGMFNRIGKLYLQTDDPEQAYRYFDLAMSLTEKKMHKKKTGELLLIHNEYSRLARLFSNKGEYEKALIYFDKQIEILNKIPQHKTHFLPTIYNNIAIVYAKDEKYQKSLDFLLRAVPINIKKFGKTDIETITLYLNIAYMYLALDNKQFALDYYNKAINSCTKGIGIHHTKCGKIYTDLTYLYFDMQLYSDMYLSAKLAYDCFLSNRDQLFSLLNEKQKEIYLKKNYSSILLMLNVTYQYLQQLKKEKNSKEIKKILQSGANTWLNYKGSIFDDENTIAMLYASTKDKKLKTKIDDLVALKRYLAKLYQSLPKPKEIETWKTDIKTTEEKINKLTHEISSKAKSFKEQQGLKSITYKDITSYLKKDELYIDFARVGNNYHFFTLDHNEKITFSLSDVNHTKKIDSLIKAFREDINTILNSKDLTDEKLKELAVRSKEKLSELYDLVIKKPFGETVKDKKSLIISPDGALRLLPFEALFNKEHNKYFIEEKEIRYIPSGKELVRLYKYSKDKVSKTQKSTVIFANPNFDTKISTASKDEITITPNTSRSGIIKSLFRMRFAALPGTKAEAKAIKATLNQKHILEYQDTKATESTLVKVKGPKILHIATHGFFINDDTIPNPMLKSGIALAGANNSAIKGKSDGIVTALKLSGLDLKGTDLVVLSACQTGVVDINATDSVSGLSKAFIQAGAKDIVMSLWSVNDEATKELMTSFYQEMNENKNYANALKVAKLKMIAEGRHPFYWAAFVVSGL